MAIAINPDVRELDFSDNVKVSKFMQDFSDFRAKKWITYRPVNAPSESEPFFGGTRQFIINMGTGHILDTMYSGLWFELYFQNNSDVVLWPIQASLPRTSSAWIESVTFQHSKVAAHIDERLCDYNAVSTIFIPAKDILSMRQTFFTTANQQFVDNNMFNDAVADDIYGKLMPVGSLTTSRISQQTFSFFIPLRYLSTIFNSGRYFFPSLLRGNGEMTLSIRSVAASLSEVFGGSRSSMAIYMNPNLDDYLWSTAASDKKINWDVCMYNMKLVTLCLDNAFLTKEYNAFIASGRKFIRSFKAYNYQFYQVKQGYNRIEIANTHQSISHIVLAFQVPYSVRVDGRAISMMDNQSFGIQKTTAGTTSQTINAKNQGAFVPTRARPSMAGHAGNNYQPAPDNPYISASSPNPPSGARSFGRKTFDLGTSIMCRIWDSAKNLNWSFLAQPTLALAASGLPKAVQPLVTATANMLVQSSLQSATRAGSVKRPAPRTTQENDLLKLQRNNTQSLARGFMDPKNRDVLGTFIDEFNKSTSGTIGMHEFNAIAHQFLIMNTAKSNLSQRQKDIFTDLMNLKKLDPVSINLIAYYAASDENGQPDITDEQVKNYLLKHNIDEADIDEVTKIIARHNLETAGVAVPKQRLALNGLEIDTNTQKVVAETMDRIFGSDDTLKTAFTESQKTYLAKILAELSDQNRLDHHKFFTQMFPAEPKQLFDLGMHVIENLQVYRGTGNGETVFSEPVNGDMFYHISREAMGDSAENHPFFSLENFNKDMAVIVISLNTFMRDAHHEFWDGFSTNRVADRLYVEFNNEEFVIPDLSKIQPWFDDIGYQDNCIGLDCKVFTIYDNIYYIDRDNNLNVSDTLLPLQEGRIPGSD